MSGSCREALPDVQEWSGVPPICPEGSSRCPGEVGMPSRVSGSCRDALPDVQDWSGGLLRCPGVVGWPTRMSESGQEALQDVQ